MSEKVSLTYQDAFMIVQAFSEVFDEKMSGSIAAKLYQYTRPFKNLFQEYQEASKSVPESSIKELNESVFCEIEKLDSSLLESIQVKPSVFVRLEKILI